MRVPLCENDVLDGAVRKRAVVEGGHLWNWLRAVRRLVKGGRAAGRCILVFGLPTVLKGIANKKVSEWSIAFAEFVDLGTSGPLLQFPVARFHAAQQ